MELNKNMPSIIQRGEGPLLEFKSTFRWGMEQSRINRLLKSVVLKSLAGFGLELEPDNTNHSIASNPTTDSALFRSF